MKRNYFVVCLLLFFEVVTSAQNIGNIGKDSDFFPIGVWVQSSNNAEAYKANGINMFVGIWGGLDQSKLDAFKKAGVKVICDQNSFGLNNLNEPTIYAWMHEDEPDNAQMNRTTKKYDPCLDPAIIIKSYENIKKKDPSRPVYINLGQGVSYINYNGRGVCKGDIDKYKVSTNGYLKGCDIASFDIYPVNNSDQETKGNLWYVAKGIDNLIEWSGRSKPAWCWIETTKISDRSSRKPTPAEVKSEVWMALVHGAMGFGYFCHSFTTNPPGDEAALLHDAEMINCVKVLNMQVNSLAPVLNSATTSGYATARSSNVEIPIDIMTKNYCGANYIFSVAMRPGTTTATFNVKEGKKIEVLGEDRNLKVKKGKFTDDFSSYGVHLYKITK